jgi:hypothetical protein
MPDLDKVIEGGVKGAAAGAAAAAAAGAVAGLTIGAAAGPFAPIVSTIAAGVGAMIGALLALFSPSPPTPEELAEARRLAAEGRKQAILNLANLYNPAYPSRNFPIQTVLGFLDKKSKERLLNNWKKLSGFPDDVDPAEYLTFPEVRKVLRDQLAKDGVSLSDDQMLAAAKAKQKLARVTAGFDAGLYKPGAPATSNLLAGAAAAVGSGGSSPATRTTSSAQPSNRGQPMSALVPLGLGAALLFLL